MNFTVWNKKNCKIYKLFCKLLIFACLGMRNIVRS